MELEIQWTLFVQNIAKITLAKSQKFSKLSRVQIPRHS
jgi:hypothetical protein